MASPQNVSIKARPRWQEKLYWYLLILSILLNIVLYFQRSYKINLTDALLVGLIIIAILFVVFKPKKKRNAHDAIELCYSERKKYLREHLDVSAARVQPVTANQWIVDFTRNAISFIVDPIDWRIIGLRTKTADALLEQTERSNILQTAARESVASQAEEEALAAAGFDVEEEKPNEE